MMQKMIPKLINVALIAAVVAIAPDHSFAKKKIEDVWQVREKLNLQLLSEYNNYNNLSKELSSVCDVFAELRDLEIFPPEITKFNDQKIVDFDVKIERLEKKYSLIKEQLDILKPQLSDAIAIFREMVTGEPVENMFGVLEKNTANRTEQMLILKSQVDSVWKKTDDLLNSIINGFGLTSDNNISRQQPDISYEKLDRLKDYLVSKGNSKSIDQMYSIEKSRIKQYIKENKLELARLKIEPLIARYDKKADPDELLLLLLKVHFLKEDYKSVLENFGKIAESSRYYLSAYLLKMQSFYSLQNYDSIWAEQVKGKYKLFNGEKRNLLIWLIMESGLAINKKDGIVQLALLVDKNGSYNLHVMHALARFYIDEGDLATSLSVLENAVKFKIFTETDKNALKDIKIAIAQNYYEIGKYEKALSLFYSILNDQSDFEPALSGIVWCYIKLDMIDKAETSLRKLINQAPESQFAAEGILILAKRYIAKADFEWKKVVYLNKEESRLNELIEKLKRLDKADTAHVNTSKFGYAKQELYTLLDRIKKEPRFDYDSISNFYSNAERVCSLIEKHYSTGAFQEVAFSSDREKILQSLDSVLAMLKEENISAINRISTELINRDRSTIKSIVEETKVFTADILIYKYRWEREYIDWQKTVLKQQEQLCSSSEKHGNSEERIQIIKKQLDTLLKHEENLQTDYFEKIISKVENILSGKLDDQDEIYFRYQLGELYYSKENVDYARAYDSYEKELTDYQKVLAYFRNGKILERPSEPVLPLLKHDKSIGQFTFLLRNFPKSDFLGAIHYSLAWCYNDLSIFDSSYAHMKTVAEYYPKCERAPQAWMYCGEQLFDKGKLDEAIHCYQAVMKYPESEWFDEALYKLAWAQYRLSNPEKAISSFLALVDLGQGTTAATLLQKESMDYIAISFSETDMTGEKGLQRATAFAKKLGDPVKGSQILHRLATVYRDQGRYDMAKNTYQALLKTYPNYQKNPIVESEYITVMDKDLQPYESNKMRMDFFKKYNHNGKWARLQNDTEAIAVADSVSEKLLYDASIGFNQLALQKNDTAIYSNALEAYKEFITAYPKSQRANECHYNLAEIEFSLGNYGDAAEEYMAVSKRYPDSKYRETAAWNAIVASQNMLKKENENHSE